MEDVDWASRMARLPDEDLFAIASANEDEGYRHEAIEAAQAELASRNLGCVDKRDSQAGGVLIQGCFLRSSYGSRGFVGRGMGGDRSAVAA